MEQMIWKRLAACFRKPQAENTRGGITYDAALGVSDLDTDLQPTDYIKPPM